MFKFMNMLISPYLKRVKLESFLKVEQIGVNGHVLLLNPVPPPDLPDSVRLFFFFLQLVHVGCFLDSTWPAVCPELNFCLPPPLLSPGSSLGGPGAGSCPPRSSRSPPQTPHTLTSPQTAEGPAAPACQPCSTPPFLAGASPPEDHSRGGA